MSSSAKGTWIIILTIAVGLVLMIIPLPEAVSRLRPATATLVLIYWWLALPEKVGITTAFIAGLIIDVITGSLLGQHALMLSLVAYLTLQFHQIIRVYPIWQQSIVVAALLYVELILNFWLKGVLGQSVSGWHYWITPLIGGLFWPWFYIILRDLRRRFHVA